jgi:hypothetical protein
MKKEKRQRIQRLHGAEKRQWGFHALHREGVWIYKIIRPLQYRSRLKGYEFDSRWVSLERDGTVTVYASKERPYAWDGCSPKYIIGNKQFIFGTPDGYRDIYMDYPITSMASLIHDAFYQYLHVIPFKKVEVDRIFKDLLKVAGFRFWPVYYTAVRLFGGHFVRQKGLNGVYEKKYRPIYLSRWDRGDLKK